MQIYPPNHNVLNYQQLGLRIMPKTEKGGAHPIPRAAILVALRFSPFSLCTFLADKNLRDSAVTIFSQM